MVVYRYYCNACEDHHDIKHSMKDDSLKVCPICGDMELRKVYTPVGLTFRGSGFYSTDK